MSAETAPQIPRGDSLGTLTDDTSAVIVERRFPPMIDLRSNTQRPLRSSGGALSPSGDRGFRSTPGFRDEAFLATDALATRSEIWVAGEPVAGTNARWRSGKRIDVDQAATLIRRAQANGEVPTIAGRSAVIERPGLNNYFHWNAEILPRLNLLAPLLRAASLDRVFVYAEHLPPFARSSLELFFPDLSDRVSGLPAPVTRFESLLYFVNAQALAKGLRMQTCASTSSRQWMRSIDEHLDRLSPTAGCDGIGERILVSRNDAHYRRLINEDELLERLGPARWRRVVCSRMSVAEQAAAFRSAKIVLGAHGAGLTNSIFCRPGTRVIELSGAYFARRSQFFCDIADQRRLDYRLVLIDEVVDPVYQGPIAPGAGIDLRMAPTAFDGLIELIER